MRIVHNFIYNGNKTFKAWELTVGDYYLFLRDPEYAIEKILSEYNDKIPKLDQWQLTRFLDILFGNNDPTAHIIKKKASKDKLDSHAADFHLQIAWMVKVLWVSVDDMPLEVFHRMSKDIELIGDPSKYKPDRHNKRLDSKALMQATGGKKSL